MQDNRKTTRINIRVTEEQKHLLEDRAGKYDMPVSEFMLQASINALVQPIPCTNFNQFARLSALMHDLNVIAKLGSDKVNAAPKLIEATKALLEAVMHDLTNIKDTRERIPLPPQARAQSSIEP
jgi:hypothetical protein